MRRILRRILAPEAIGPTIGDKCKTLRVFAHSSGFSVTMGAKYQTIVLGPRVHCMIHISERTSNSGLSSAPRLGADASGRQLSKSGRVEINTVM